MKKACPEASRAVSEELRQTIVLLLSEGLEDKVIARRLGMSERTCQRHIAEIMRAIGAKSRFQAGYLLRARQPPANPGPPVPGSGGPCGTAGSA
ncbi:LuxR C-terminal-related transcriptional regulator [Streptomyces sp. NPDC012794]|uniref:LuxR C-terminal-related transcriptional regulator n=1 Tax=Streptomyces sp. NPDC012794 TaxID=3364850 RepID=UPI00368774DB